MASTLLLIFPAILQVAFCIPVDDTQATPIFPTLPEARFSPAQPSDLETSSTSPSIITLHDGEIEHVAHSDHDQDLQASIQHPNVCLPETFPTQINRIENCGTPACNSFLTTSSIPVAPDFPNFHPDVSEISSSRPCECITHRVENIIRPVYEEVIQQVPVIAKCLKHRLEELTRHIPIVENFVTHEKEKIVRHVPVVHKCTRNVIETMTRHVPVIRHRTRTVEEPYTEHVKITEKITKPVIETVFKKVPILMRRIKPIVQERIRHVPIVENRVRPVIEETVTTVPVRQRIIKHLVEQTIRPVITPCSSCGTESGTNVYESAPTIIGQNNLPSFTDFHSMPTKRSVESSPEGFPSPLPQNNAAVNDLESSVCTPLFLSSPSKNEVPTSLENINITPPRNVPQDTFNDKIYKDNQPTSGNVFLQPSQETYDEPQEINDQNDNTERYYLDKIHNEEAPNIESNNVFDGENEVQGSSGPFNFDHLNNERRFTNYV